MNELLQKFDLSDELKGVLNNCAGVYTPATKEELYKLVYGKEDGMKHDVIYSIPGKGDMKEADVVRCKNGAVVNYTEDYMRRRDPDCMVIADEKPTDKPRFRDTYGKAFDSIREETFEWLKTQELVVIPFNAGGNVYGYGSLLVCPLNAAFFAYAVALLQGFVNAEESKGFRPRAIIYVAPPFRHTHFKGKQVCVHNRIDDCHEIFSYNLYPGPSAKKGVYSVLLDIGESEGWVTAHASCAKVVTPYENETVIMHEGASGGGKSELLEEVKKLSDDRVLLGTHTITGEKNYIHMGDTCTIKPVTDDMAICHPDFQNQSGKLCLTDGEDGWFLRVDGITEYGSNPEHEKLSVHPNEPLIFFNLQGVPGSTCLLWEHTIDSDGKPCPNPRVIIPRKNIENIVTEPVEVSVRSFGVRMPPSTAENPNYGIMGMLHIIPPALAWLWRLVSPRGHKNPSIVDSTGMVSEGVGSYWPFATGEQVKQANLLLEQILSSPNTKYVLIPNQHIGVYQVGFAPENIVVEYLARRGGVNFKMDHLVESRCPILGYALKEMKVDGQYIRSKFLRCEKQDLLGIDGYDQGAKILTDFFARELEKFDTPDLHPLGREIIACFKNGGSVEDYCKLTPLGLY
ncbi:DUF4914 family protein [Anaerosporobacter faecicola]|uniref:DUF4914 family protein n=1 Tax=Anaerosporobacter faecicola TaxID=2718714 RepID=UPI00143C569B|nr:DUF4914 family protein [Anaerosporobacter faecicola]